ncbi:hypothetical protein TNCV_3798011 [Trichonephila clavipes]|nr:hypothetical protein TNCV_3798011 [Trichonephila clavipes]
MTISHSSSRWLCQGALPSTIEYLFLPGTQGYYDLENVLRGDSRTLNSDRRKRESCRLPEHNCGTVAPLYVMSVFPTGNGIFQQDSVPSQNVAAKL